MAQLIRGFEKALFGWSLVLKDSVESLSLTAEWCQHLTIFAIYFSIAI